MKTHTSLITIDKQALQHNLAQIRARVSPSKILAMVKANAYGHGMITVAHALPQVEGFGVACLAEALQLRESGITQRIVLMRGVMSSEELLAVAHYQLDIVVHTHEQVLLLEENTLKTSLTVWLKINTGMNRLGFFPEDAYDISMRLARIASVAKPLVFMTHFASAEEDSQTTTVQQIHCFKNSVRDIAGEKSLSNSAGILVSKESHADWVRPGLMLYGVSPLPSKTAADFNLLPVMTFQSELISVRHQRLGDRIGYGGVGICPEDMLIGIVGVGYADGYPRHAREGTPLLINNTRVSLTGRVSMDMLAVDLRALPNARCGDKVILWGQGLPVEEVATHTATIAYELLCHVRPRGKTVEVK